MNLWRVKAGGLSAAILNHILSNKKILLKFHRIIEAFYIVKVLVVKTFTPSILPIHDKLNKQSITSI